MKQKLIKIAKWVFNLLKRIFKAIFIHEKACCKSILLFMVILTSQNIFAQKTVHYDLHIKDTTNSNAHFNLYRGRYSRNICL